MAMALQNDASVNQSSHNSSQEMDHERCDRIYTDFFNLKGAPFSITPDPEFLFLSETHRSVIEKIQYGIQSRMGFMLLTGEVGTGKTTLCRALLDQLQSHIRTVYVINPSLGSQELLAGILDDLGIDYPTTASKKELIDHLNQFLLANENQSPVVIIVDDAQTMPTATLEDLRLLSNLETDKTKLLQMLLVGQPELLTNLDQPQMRQLKQRVAINCHLDYLAFDEVGGYIERRLFIAGNQGQIRFLPKVLKQIHRYSGGVPRVINKICDMALIAAYAKNSFTVNSDHLKAAAGELIEMRNVRRGDSIANRIRDRRSVTVLVAVSALLGAMALGFAVRCYLGNDTAGSVAPMAISHNTHPGDSGQPPAELIAHQAKAYILQLGSFNTLATTLRAVDIYTQKGVEAHWNNVQMGPKGLWYRVFAGRFNSIAEARQFQSSMGLADTRILFAPWAVLLDKAGPAKHNNSQAFYIYSYEPGGNRVEIYTSGFFVFAPDFEPIVWDEASRGKGVYWGGALPDSCQSVRPKAKAPLTTRLGAAAR